MKIECSGCVLSGLTDKSSSHGHFTNSTLNMSYTGQISDHKAHGRGVWNNCDDQHSGDWVDGHFQGYGEGVYDNGTYYYLGQWNVNDKNGFGEELYQGHVYVGEWVKGCIEGGIRHTSPDGHVAHTVWKRDRDTGTPCDADKFVSQAEEGLLQWLLCRSVASD